MCWCACQRVCACACSMLKPAACRDWPSPTCLHGVFPTSGAFPPTLRRYSSSGMGAGRNGGKVFLFALRAAKKDCKCKRAFEGKCQRDFSSPSPLPPTPPHPHSLHLVFHTEGTRFFPALPGADWGLVERKGRERKGKDGNGPVWR